VVGETSILRWRPASVLSPCERLACLSMKGGSPRIVDTLRFFTLFFIFHFSSDVVIYVLDVWFIFNLLGYTRSSYFILIFENLGIWFFFNLLVFLFLIFRFSFQTK
jgi:hypothetical protein